jgi:hypothetical protein
MKKIAKGHRELAVILTGMLGQLDLDDVEHAAPCQAQDAVSRRFQHLD